MTNPLQSSLLRIQAINKSRLINIVTSIITLFLGSLIYLTFRSSSLLMFKWVDYYTLSIPVMFLRSWGFYLKPYVYTWVIYSLPFSLWLLSYMALVNSIWHGTKTKIQILWLWSIPVIAIESELFQYCSLLPGHFDPVDLTLLALATVIGFALSKQFINRSGVSHEKP